MGQVQRTTASAMLGVAAGALLAASISATTAQASEPTPPPKAMEPAKGWKVSVTPRYWHFWEHDFYFQKDNFFPTLGLFGVGFQQSNEATEIDFRGGSITVTDPRNISYSLTVLQGEGEGRVFGIGTGFLGLAQTYNGTVDVERIDVEAIVQLPVAEGLTWLAGGRWIKFTRNEEGTFSNFFIAGLPTINFDLEQDFYLGELGFTVVRPMKNNKVFFFGNVTGMAGYADAKGEIAGFPQRPLAAGGPDFGVFNLPIEALEGAVVGIDTNAGIAFQVAEGALVSGRYRLFYMTPPDAMFDDGGTFIHGPEVNLTLTFGGK